MFSCKRNRVVDDGFDDGFDVGPEAKAARRSSVELADSSALVPAVQESPSDPGDASVCSPTSIVH
jgi:hypothetical protein